MMWAYPEPLTPWVVGFAVVFGLCFGSFANVMALRLLSESAKQDALLQKELEKAEQEKQSQDKPEQDSQTEGEPVPTPEPSLGLVEFIKEFFKSYGEVIQLVSHPPSHCPGCMTPIKPIDNIPVLSYLMLGGKCRHCKAGISPIYPAFELFCAVLFGAVVFQFGVSLQSLFLLFMMFNFVVITITDLKESYIFQINSLTLIPAGILYNVLNLGQTPDMVVSLGSWAMTMPEGLLSGLLGIALAFIFFEGMILLSETVFGTEGFGHGDTHLMMGVGAFLGWPLTALSLALGFVLQSVLAIPMLVFQWIKNKNYPSLTSGGLAMAFVALPLWLMNLPKGHPLAEQANTLSLVSLFLCLVCLVYFLKLVKENQTYTYVPLGPALVLGSVVSLFWGQPLLAAIAKLYGY